MGHVANRRPIIAFGVRVLTVVAIVAAMGEPVTATPVADGGRIAFALDGDVWVMNADGSGRTRLTTLPGEEFDPSWSPDGSMIAYRDSRRGINNDDEIYAMRADGSGQIDLTNDPANDWSPAWSPDGTKIAFTSDRAGGFPRLFLMDPNGGNPTALTEGWGEYPSWSPDGSRIVYECFQGGGSSPRSRPNYDVCAVNVDGTDEINLTNHPAYDGFPAWSSEGDRIAFQTERDSCPDGQVVESEEVCEDGAVVYVMTARGTDPVRVSEPALGGTELPVWSPDGAHLCFVRSGHIVVTDSDGGDLRDLGPGGFPDWSRV